MESDLLVIGVLTKPQGIRGELRVHAYNPESEAWDQLSALCVLSQGAKLAVKSVRRGPKFFTLRVEGIADRDRAEALRGAEVHVARSALTALEEDEYYLADLEGAKVEFEGAIVGEITRIWEYPSCDCAEIQFADGVREIPLMPPWIRDVKLDQDPPIVALGSYEDVPLR